MKCVRRNNSYYTPSLSFTDYETFLITDILVLTLIAENVLIFQNNYPWCCSEFSIVAYVRDQKMKCVRRNNSYYTPSLSFTVYETFLVTNILVLTLIAESVLIFQNNYPWSCSNTAYHWVHKNVNLLIIHISLSDVKLLILQLGNAYKFQVQSRNNDTNVINAVLTHN
jgi:hypothetical protein